MAVRVYCPHCITPCVVSADNLSVAVRCYKCKKPFTASPKAATKMPSTDPVPPASGACRLDIGSATSKGRVRERNEDSLFVQQLRWISMDERHEIALIVVADGMGGYGGGDIASRIVIRTMGNVLAPLLNGALNGKFKDISSPELADTVDYAIQEANLAVRRKAKSDTRLKGMGATVAVVLVWDGQALLGHVGDCRVYFQREGVLTQVTKDQTLVARMVELGQLTPEEAENHPQSNEVTQAIGKRATIEPARYRLQLHRGDWLIVACDGLHAHVERKEIQETIEHSAYSALALSENLVQLTDDLGGTDNCTVVSAYCH